MRIEGVEQEISYALNVSAGKYDVEAKLYFTRHKFWQNNYKNTGISKSIIFLNLLCTLSWCYKRNRLLLNRILLDNILRIIFFSW